MQLQFQVDQHLFQPGLASEESKSPTRRRKLPELVGGLSATFFPIHGREESIRLSEAEEKNWLPPQSFKNWLPPHWTPGLCSPCRSPLRAGNNTGFFPEDEVSISKENPFSFFGNQARASPEQRWQC